MPLFLQFNDFAMALVWLWRKGDFEWAKSSQI